MDPKYVQSDMKKAMLLPSVEHKSEIFAARGIFSNGAAFTCLICDKTFAHINMVPGHMIGQRHCAKLEMAYASYLKADGCFACTICSCYVAADWKLFLCHLNEKHHYEELDDKRIRALSRDSQTTEPIFSYISLLTNQIIEHASGTFFCCCCQKFIVGRNPILQHITEKRHQEFKETCHTEKYPGNYTENKSLRLVKNDIVHVNSSTFNCNLCNVVSIGVKGCQKHIRTKEHIQNIIMRENARSQLLFKNGKEDSPNNPPIEISKFFVKLMRDNSITGPLPTDRYQCKLCESTLYGWKNVFPHVYGNRHKKSIDAGSIESKLAPESEETSDGSSSSCVSTGNTSESWETYEGESQSSYENSSCDWESSDKSSDSWETISIHGSSSESQGSLPFEIPANWVSLIPKHHLQYRKREIFCALCEAHLRSLQSLIDHTRSKYHIAELNRYKDQAAKENNKKSATSEKSSAVSSPVNAVNQKPVIKSEISTRMQANVADKAGSRQSMLFDIPKMLTPLISRHMLEYREKELFCVACEAHLQTLKSLEDHTRSKYHVSKLDSYKTKIATQRKELADTSGRNSTSSSVINTKREACTTIQKAKTKEAQSSQAKLFNLPDFLIPLLASHSLQRFEHEVFCPACQVHLRHVNNLVEHTSSQYHIAALQIFREMSENGQRSTTLLKTHAAVSSPKHLANEKASNVKSQSNTVTLKTSTSDPQNPQSSLMEIPKKLLPLIVKHSLKHLKDEIYCVACKAHLKDPSSLVSHTNSPRHAATLESFKASTTLATENNMEAHVIKIDPYPRRITSESESQTGLENSLSKLAIVEVKEKPSKKLFQNLLKNTMGRSPRQMRARKSDNRPKKRRAFDPKYLKVDMQHVYEVNPEKLRIMKLSCQLCFPKTSSTVYCLICERSVSSKLQTFYEHICSSAHTVYLAEAEANDKHFINYPDQFSDLSLAKEYMQESQKETIQCFSCDTTLKNDDIVILEHVREDSHKEGKQLWNEAMEKILQNILTEMAATWYNIQKYWCQPCDTEYNTEFHFAEHMESKKHKNCLKKMTGFQHRLVYDSCIACATLWQGFAGVYPQHCEQPMHKYLVQSGDFSVCKLPNQAMILLKNADPEVTSLIELSDQVLTVQKVKADTLLKCLEDTVKPLHPNAKAYPFGSRVSGLGFPDSDIDVFLDCGTYDGKENSREHQQELITSVECCLYANQEEWEIEETLVTTRTPIIKLRHRATELRCDVSFKNGLSVENTKLLKCFIDNYPLCRRLMLFLKKWLSYCNLSGSQYITNYATCWYVIFYLQTKSILPSIASMIAKENKSKVIDGWETGISEKFNVDEQKYTFTELLHGFFDFYANFDYRDSVACPIIGRTMPKQDFTELDLLPNAMAPYINHVKTKSVDGLVELFRIDSEMCIQDPYDLSHNLTKAVRKFTLNRFKRLCATSADILNNFIQH